MHPARGDRALVVKGTPMSESRPSVTLKVAERVIPEDLRRGVYAMQIQQMSTLHDSIIDFSSITPADYGHNDAGQLDFDTVRLQAEVVARVIVRTDVLNEFVRSYVRANPSALQDPESFGADGEEGAEDGEVSDDSR